MRHFAPRMTTFLLALAPAVAFAGGEEDTPATDAVREAAAIWNTIRAAMPEDESADTFDERLTYWWEVADQVQPKFWKLAEGDGLREKMAYYVDQFGRHGPQADMRWMLAGVYMVLPYDLAEPFPPPRLVRTAPDRQEFQEKFRRLEMAASEELVRRFLADPDYLERYYKMLVWSRYYLRPFLEPDELFFFIYAHTPARGMRERPVDEYWWYARKFVLLAHATGRDDLLEGADPEELAGLAAEWYRWCLTWVYVLRPDPEYPRWIIDEEAKRRMTPLRTDDWLPLFEFPEVPFEDWNGPPPPPHDLILLLR